MSLKTPPIFSERLMRDRHLTTEGKMGDRSVVPVLSKLGNMRGQGPWMRSTGGGDAVADASSAMRSFADGVQQVKGAVSNAPIEGGSFVALPSISYLPVAISGIKEKVKEYNRSKDIGDSTGQHLAGLQGTEYSLQAAGSVTVLGLQAFSAIQDVTLAMGHPIAFTGALATAQSALSWGTTALYAIYYILNIVRHGFGLVSWYQGRILRKELLEAKDPVGVLYRQFKEQSYSINMTSEEYIDLALKSGASWLEKLSKEEAGKGLKKIKDKKEAFRQLIGANSGIISQVIGDYGKVLTPRQELIRFGKFLAYQNACAKFEMECSRKLGSKAVEALKTGNANELKVALKAKEWVVSAVKIGIAVIGLASLITMSVFMGGIPVGVLLLLAGISGLAMICLGDGAALKEHLANGEFKSRDRVFIITSLVLSIISVAGLVTLSVLTGGIVPFLGALILSAVWLGMNVHTTGMLWKYDHRTWDVQKVVDRASYRRFLERAPKPESIAKIQAKMKVEDQELVRGKSIEELKQEEERLIKHRNQQMKQLITYLA